MITSTDVQDRLDEKKVSEARMDIDALALGVDWESFEDDGCDPMFAAGLLLGVELERERQDKIATAVAEVGGITLFAPVDVA